MATGTGVLPRNMYRYGAKWTGTDISENQIEQTKSKFFHILKPNGRILVLYMAWLPFEDKIAEASEKLVLKYSPKWSGAWLVVGKSANQYPHQFRFHLPEAMPCQSQPPETKRPVR